jgi:release factor glutamine methyltransferase
MQTIWTIQKILSWTEDYFNKNKVPEPRLSAELLLAKILNIKRLDLYLQFERILIPEELKQYRQFVQRRAKYEPVQYITGEQEFMGFTFTVTRDVLIPRPETELLVESIMQEIQGDTIQQLAILDIGTGSGAIAISLALHCKNCSITAIDQNASALSVARQNAQKLGVNNIQFLEHDALGKETNSLPKFNFVVSNPPYISEKDYQQLHPQVKNFEPREALLAGESGLYFIENLIPKCRELLQPAGRLFLEIGYDQSEQVQQLCIQNQFTNIELIKDYNNFTRIVKAKI